MLQDVIPYPSMNHLQMSLYDDIQNQNEIDLFNHSNFLTSQPKEFD